MVDVYARAEDWRRERCEGQEGEIRIAALGLSLPLREVYADVLADLPIEPWRDAALRGCEKTVASEGRSRCIPS